MPRAKISEFSTTPGDNTDIDGINIAEGCAPSGINDAIRELMAQLKDFQSGAAGDNITVVGTLAAKGTSSSGADLKLYEDTDNGTNYVGFIAPASIASNVQWTLPSADGSSGQALQTNGSGTLSFATLGISAGGTGQTTANAAFNALAPSQTSNAGRYLKTDGTNTSWDLLDISTADITGTLPVANGGTGITSFGTGVATALGINVGSSGAFVTNGGALGTPSSGTVTNLTGTASININGTVGATTPNTGSFTTLTTSSTVTINGGTANGVAYLNGSKVLTTGSALTFDGTNLGLGGTTNSYGSQTTFTLSGTNVSRIDFRSNSTFTGSLLSYQAVGEGLRLQTESSLPIVFSPGGTEGMRLTSTGLGIGTSSPAYKLQITGGGENGTQVGIFSSGNPTRGLTIGLSANSSVNDAYVNYNATIGTYGGHRWLQNGSQQMLLDGSGNLGLGVTPSAWGSVSRAMQFQNGVSIFSNSSGLGGLGNNVYSNPGTADYYIATGFATRYYQFNGTHVWNTAPSGNAGDTISFTQAMTLDASGNLGLGTTSPGSFAGTVKLVVGNAATTTTPGAITVYSGTATYGGLYFADGTVGDQLYRGAVEYNHSTDALLLYSAGSERARITSGGDLLVGTTSLGAWDTRLTLSSDTGTTKWGVGPYSTATNFVISASASAGVYLAGTTATSWSSVSDERHKDIIEPIANAAEKVCTLRAVIGKYKADETSTRKSFLIAQDVLAVLPEAVDISNPERFGLAYSDMVPLLVAAIQEQQALITDLRARVAALESQA